MNITGLGTAIENPWKAQKIALTLYKAGLRKANMVFFQNTANRDFMLEHHAIKGKYDVLPGSGVNLSQYQVTEYPDGDTIDFAFVSRIMKEKGIDQYLDAAKAVRKEYPETRFHIWGGYEQEYKEVIEELHNNGTVIYHGTEKIWLLYTVKYL